jgi:hypothetical protein
VRQRQGQCGKYETINNQLQGMTAGKAALAMMMSIIFVYVSNIMVMVRKNGLARIIICNDLLFPTLVLCCKNIPVLCVVIEDSKRK